MAHTGKHLEERLATRADGPARRALRLSDAAGTRVEASAGNGPDAASVFFQRVRRLRPTRGEVEELGRLLLFREGLPDEELPRLRREATLQLWLTRRWEARQPRAC